MVFGVNCFFYDESRAKLSVSTLGYVGSGAYLLPGKAPEKVKAMLNVV